MILMPHVCVDSMQADAVQDQSLFGIVIMIAMLRVNRVTCQSVTFFDAIALECEAVRRQLGNKTQSSFGWTSPCDDKVMWGIHQGLMDAGLISEANPGYASPLCPVCPVCLDGRLYCHCC